MMEKQDIENQKKNLTKVRATNKRKTNNDDSRSKFVSFDDKMIFMFLKKFWTIVLENFNQSQIFVRLFNKQVDLDDRFVYEM